MMHDGSWIMADELITLGSNVLKIMMVEIKVIFKIGAITLN